MLCISLCVCGSLAVKTLQAAGHELERMSIGTPYSIDSELLEGQREVLVSLPSDYESESVEAYPVLYVLDADSEFLHSVAAVRYLGENANSIPDFIVVGILHIRRGDEMRPTFPASGESNPQEQLFREHIADELIPFIDSNFRTEPFRVIAGHSLGGLFVLNTLQETPTAFHAHIASSPALWWEDGRQLQKLIQSQSDADNAGTTLLMTIGNEGSESESLFTDFSESFASNSSSDLHHFTTTLSDYSHGEVFPASLYWSLTKIFVGWVPGVETYRRGLSGLIEHYDALSAQYGWEISVPIDTLSALTFEFARRGEPGDEAKVRELVEYGTTRHAGMVLELQELANALEMQNHRQAATSIRTLLGEPEN